MKNSVMILILFYVFLIMGCSEGDVNSRANSNLEGTDPGSDTNIWGTGGATDPNPDTSGPGPDTSGPGPDTSGPGPDTSGPGPDTSGPGPDTSGPGPDTSGPGPDTSGPGPDTSGPGPDTNNNTGSNEYYFQAGDWAGYGWTGIGPAAGGTVTELTRDWTSGSTPVCISGTLAADYSSLGVLGMAVSQARGSQTMNTWSPGSQYTGVEVDISKRVNTAIRMELVTANGEYCAVIPAGGVTLAWSAFATECWGTSGTRYNGQPFDRIQFYAPGDRDSTVNYDYCLNALSPHTGTIEQDTDTGSNENPGDANWVSQDSICGNEIGNQGGFVYEYWVDSGNACMELGPGGAFSIEWGAGTNNILGRKGLRPGSLNQVITYAADYRPNGNSYLTLYGWTRNPLVEYYVVDSWGSWRPPGGTRVGTVNSDGGTYDLYRTQRVNEPSIDGTQTFYQYWSVRTEKRTSGTITFANHVAAWQNQGWQMGSLYEVSMCVEGYQSTGYGNVYQLTMTTGN